MTLIIFYSALFIILLLIRRPIQRYTVIKKQQQQQQKTIMADIGIHGAHVHTERTQIPEGQEERGGSPFQATFCQVLIEIHQ